MLHKYSRLVVASTVLLILAGSFVTSTDSGLSVPDWPTTYGWNMFTFPPSKMVGRIFYEHGHRLIASSVGMLTIVLAAWLWMAERRRWLRWMGVGALGVINRGVEVRPGGCRPQPAENHQPEKSGPVANREHGDPFLNRVQSPWHQGFPQETQGSDGHRG